MTVTPEQANAYAALYQRFSDPHVANSLATLLDHADLLALLVEALDSFVARSEVIGDNLVSSITELREASGGSGGSGVDVAALAQSATMLAAALPQAAPGIVRLVESGTADKLIATTEVSAEALDQVQLIARGLKRGSDDFVTRPVQVGGVLSAAKLLKDPDIARALSFFATVAKAVGQELATPTTNPPA
ncbi:MAG: DUF1641 domain-containing protein [Nocardioidaceae bacterium]